MCKQVLSAALTILPLVLGGCGVGGAYALQYAAMAPGIPGMTRAALGGSGSSSPKASFTESALKNDWCDDDTAGYKPVCDKIMPSDISVAQECYAKVFIAATTEGKKTPPCPWSNKDTGHAGLIESVSSLYLKNGLTCMDLRHAWSSAPPTEVGWTSCQQVQRVTGGTKTFWVPLKESRKLVTSTTGTRP